MTFVGWGKEKQQLSLRAPRGSRAPCSFLLGRGAIYVGEMGPCLCFSESQLGRDAVRWSGSFGGLFLCLLKL